MKFGLCVCVVVTIFLHHHSRRITSVVWHLRMKSRFSSNMGIALKRVIVLQKFTRPQFSFSQLSAEGGCHSDDLFSGKNRFKVRFDQERKKFFCFRHASNTMWALHKSTMCFRSFFNFNILFFVYFRSKNIFSLNTT